MGTSTSSDLNYSGIPLVNQSVAISCHWKQFLALKHSSQFVWILLS